MVDLVRAATRLYARRPSDRRWSRIQAKSVSDSGLGDVSIEATTLNKVLHWGSKSKGNIVQMRFVREPYLDMKFDASVQIVKMAPDRIGYVVHTLMLDLERRTPKLL